ncbi:MAG: UDP-3-O-(3-hydroxymyristoyl)glucosamine N-acyltransferase [Syntrophales bacterium]|nr:UDP-3-O-(3-hydroxymyristoyl)glucosamine N-acyltransferase [Syntrophales bacterium]
MEKTLKEIADFIGGRLLGDPHVVIKGLKGITEAEPGDLTFIANRRYLKYLASTRASAVVVSPEIEQANLNLVQVDDPYTAFGRLISWFYPMEKEKPFISPQAYIDPSAMVSPEATVFPGVFIDAEVEVGRGAVIYAGVSIGKGAKIGEDTILHPNVVIYPQCIIGNRVIIHAGAVIGADGFGFAHPGRENIKIPQAGIVQIDDDVEIGANTTIDRATLGRTWIKRGTKIDNLVQIGHNVTVGERAIIVSQVGISGSTRLGNGVILGGQVGIVGHIEIGDGCIVAARSAVHNDVPAGQIIAGAPHMPYKKWLRVTGALSRLPDWMKKITDLTNRLTQVEKFLEDRKK